jgi:hypothetical protein
MTTHVCALNNPTQIAEPNRAVSCCVVLCGVSLQQEEARARAEAQAQAQQEQRRKQEEQKRKQEEARAAAADAARKKQVCYQ